jgi:hypothetical protein
MMFAQATNEFWGQWMIVSLGVIGGIGGLASLASYFATRRELVALEQRVAHMEQETKNDRRDYQVDASHRNQVIFAEIKDIREKLSARIDPLVENTAALKGSHEALLVALNNQTEMLRQLGARRS